MIFSKLKRKVNEEVTETEVAQAEEEVAPQEETAETETS